MRKVFIGFLSLFCFFLIVGCEHNLSARETVSQYLDLYVNLDSQVVGQLEELASKEYTNHRLKDLYIDVMKSQYSTMHYQIVSERYDGDEAYITTRITVRDLYKVQRDANAYLNEHPENFRLSNGDYDEEKFLNYKLEEMDKTVTTTMYDIEIKLLKQDEKWEVMQPTNQDLEKIHGIYNYES